MGLSEIQAIEVKDYSGQPFFAFWRANGLESGTLIPDSIQLNQTLSASQESHYQNEKVGTIKLYVTDEYLQARLRAKYGECQGPGCRFPQGN